LDAIRTAYCIVTAITRASLGDGAEALRDRDIPKRGTRKYDGCVEDGARVTRPPTDVFRSRVRRERNAPLCGNNGVSKRLFPTKRDPGLLGEMPLYDIVVVINYLRAETRLIILRT